MANPTAVLQIRVNSGPWVMGEGVQVQPEDTISLRAQSYAGWSSPAARWEFPAGAFPEGWPAPAGWTLGDDGSVYYLSDPLTSMAPPSFDMPDAADVMAGLWGKWLLRLIVNGQFFDESIGIELLSQLGFTETGLSEARQFNPVRAYLAGEQANIRKVDVMLAAGGGGGGLQLGAVAGEPCSAAAGVVGGGITAAGSLHTHPILVGTPISIGTSNSAGASNNLSRADHGHNHGAQTDPTHHALATGGANGFFSATGFVKLAGIETGAQVTSYAHIVTACAGANAALGMNGQRITGLGVASAASDAVTLSQLQAVATGLDLKPEVRGASLANQSLSNALTEDGITYDDDDRYLAKNQTDQTENGIYIVDTTGPWARAPDADADAEVTPGMFVFVLEGTANQKTGWALLAPGPITLGVTNLPFTQIFGVGTIVAGDGIVQSGNTFHLDLGDGSLVFAGGQVKVGVLSAAQHGVQTDETLHALATDSTDGFINAANWDAINTRTATPTANKVVIYGASAEVNGAYFAGTGTVAGTGVLRCANNTTLAAAKDSGNNDTSCLALDGADLLAVGDQTRVANMKCHVKTGGQVDLCVNNTARWTVTATGATPNGNKITNVGTPTASGDAATKGYVDARFYQAEQLFFAGIFDTSQIGEQSFGARTVDAPTNQPWATTATFIAGIAASSSPAHVDLYRPSDMTVIALLTTSLSGVELTADVTSEIIGAGSDLIVARVRADVDTLINSLFTKFNAHVILTAGGVHTNADNADVVSGVTYPPAVDLATRMARINALCDAYELHRVKDTGSSPAIHINAGGDTTNGLAITSPATDEDLARARALDLQEKLNAHLADVTSHGAQDGANHILGPGSAATFFAAIRFT